MKLKIMKIRNEERNETMERLKRRHALRKADGKCRSEAESNKVQGGEKNYKSYNFTINYNLCESKSSPVYQMYLIT